MVDTLPFGKKNDSEPAVTMVKRNKLPGKPESSLTVVPSNYQHVGSRGNQEDSFAFSDLGDQAAIDRVGVMAVVADGMGGLEYGEEASRVAVASFLSEYNLEIDNESVIDRLTRAITVSNTAVYDLAYKGAKGEIDLGTTLVAAVVLRDQLYWVSAGDSRLYLYRENHMQQLTLDHIYANHLQVDVDNGKLTQDEADRNPERNYLTSYLGLPRISELDYSKQSLPLQAGDKVILCSDGLYDTLSEIAIATVLDNYSAADYGEELVKAALAAGNPHQDNITVAVFSLV